MKLLSVCAMSRTAGVLKQSFCCTGDPNCIHIASTVIQANQTYTVVVSDADSFDAVLPMRIVKYIYVSP